MGERLSRRAEEDANVTIPAAISVAPSQYWDGNGKGIWNESSEVLEC